MNFGALFANGRAWLSSNCPQSIIALRTYNTRTFVADLIAGITVGLVALPLAMAFAISSNVPPESGLYCAVIAGFLISALGGSMTQIGGPTGAFVVVVAGIVQKHGIDGLFMTTMMAGVLLFALGATGLGTAVKFIPRPVVIGFTNGIAILIASTQIKDFLGLKIEHVPGEFAPRMTALSGHLNSISPSATLLATASLIGILILSKFTKRVPGSILALILGTAAVAAFHLPVETIGSRFGGIPQGLPQLKVPSFRMDLLLPLLSPVLTVTMLGAIESLLSAVVSDRMSGKTHNPNTELMAQGVANIASPLFGGLPATGAIARTATNVRSGAQTPIAGMVHAITLLIILLCGASLSKQIPLAVLSAILIVVAYNMGEWSEIPEIVRAGKAPAAVWLITVSLTVFADLTVAVEAGMILAMFLYVHRVSATTSVDLVTEEYIEEGKRHSLQAVEIPSGVAIFRIHGPFLFGATDKLAVVEAQLNELPDVVVFRLRNMTAIDTTGLRALHDVAVKLKNSGRHLILCGARTQPAKIIAGSELEKSIGKENICTHLHDAVQRATELLKEKSG